MLKLWARASAVADVRPLLGSSIFINDMEYYHRNNFSRKDIEIRATNEPEGPYGSAIEVKGIILGSHPIPRIDSEGLQVVVGLVIIDPDSGNTVMEYRHVIEGLDDLNNGVFLAQVQTKQLRPKTYDLRIQLVVDWVAWFEWASTTTKLHVLDSDVFMDVGKLMKTYSVEELCKSAEDYFKYYETETSLFVKPFNVVDIQHSLAGFAFVVRGLRLEPRMTVVDFGAGTGWASRLFNKIGMEVYSCDVSATALRMAEKINEKEHSFTSLPPIHSLHFNGHKIDLPDASVDRLACFAALHHVPNLEETIAEFARILKPGGRAGFDEPGPNHSLTVEAQAEMRGFKVVENDIHLSEINEIAVSVGFKPIEVMLQNALPDMTSLTDYLTLSPGSAAATAYVHSLIERSKWSQIFFLEKA